MIVERGDNMDYPEMRDVLKRGDSLRMEWIGPNTVGVFIRKHVYAGPVVVDWERRPCWGGVATVRNAAVSSGASVK